MSIIFGIRRLLGATITRQELLGLASATERYALDGVSVAAQGPIGMGFQPYHTHQRSTIESQPLLDECGNMLVLDGRIDNHEELRKLLDLRGDAGPDSSIVLAAFRRWGEECFSRLIGDWALAIWVSLERVLYLARDHAGTRTLYFEQTAEIILWSTYLETFFVQRRTRELDENYAACYLACRPLRNLTPYKGIKAVSPAHYVKLQNCVAVQRAHWNWIVDDRLRYRSDSEYDQQFLTLLRQSVDRRTGPGAPILAQLSGGMDSSAIVCISDDQRIRDGASPVDLLDTISFYDDSEPDWNEKPYYSVVEAKRGKKGIHVDSATFARTLDLPDDPPGEQLLPGRDSSTPRREKAIESLFRAHEYRVILSGIGGDELLGGVPNPLPELADLIVAGKFASFFTHGTSWCLSDRIPLIHIFFRTVAHLSQLYFRDRGWRESLPPWLCRRLRNACGESLQRDVNQVVRIRHKPSSIDNGLAWWSIMETLPQTNPDLLVRYEYRFPYLDRDLVDFLLRVPREQLLRPGRRRLMMRRALKGIVPEEILERRRKAFLSRNMVRLLDSQYATVMALASSSGYVADGNLDLGKIDQALNRVIQKRDGRWAQPLLRTALFVLWIKAAQTLSRTAEHSEVSATPSEFAP